jgi:multidrug resistance efflux pump
MKMFNKVVAPFAGTVDQVLVEGDGAIIAKGQPLFKVTPDEVVEVLSEAELAAARTAHTVELVNRFISSGHRGSTE